MGTMSNAPIQSKKEYAQTTVGEKIAMWLVIAIIVYLVIAG